MTSFDWNDYLTLAEYLSENRAATGVPEAALRSAVSRAYYYAYGQGWRWATQQSPQPFVPQHRGADHGAFRSWLRSRSLNGAAQILERLHNWRIVCDYRDVDSPQLAAACPFVLRQARAFLRMLGVTR